MPRRHLRNPRFRYVPGLSGGLAAVLLAVLLAACGSDPPPPCPRLAMLPNTDRIVKFLGEGRDLTDVEYEAAIRDPFFSCETDETGVDVLLTVNFVALRGPADEDRKADIAYFVAVTDLDGNVLARQEFTATLSFEGNQTRVAGFEEIAPRIPLTPEQSGADFAILVGLRLTPDELRYNQLNL